MIDPSESEAPRQPLVDRPRMYGGHLEPTRLPWAWAVERLLAAHSYWIATTRPDGRPHTRPVWAVWLDGAVCFSTGSLAAANLADRPDITVHLESGTEVVILEGTAAVISTEAVIVRVCAAYNTKYAEDLTAETLPGPFHEVRPRVAFGWVAADTFTDAGASFHGTATRWRFD